MENPCAGWCRWRVDLSRLAQVGSPVDVPSLEGGIDLRPISGGPDDRTGPDVTGQSEGIRPTPRPPTPARECLTLQWRGWDSGRSPGARGVENGPPGCGKEPRSLI
jgi:hypothetical protein